VQQRAVASTVIVVVDALIKHDSSEETVAFTTFESLLPVNIKGTDNETELLVVWYQRLRETCCFSLHGKA
jgi:hypothetical protein